MEKETVIIYFVLLFTASGVICQHDRHTNSSNSNDTGNSPQCSGRNCSLNNNGSEQMEPSSQSASSTTPPFWCPDGYVLVKIASKWVHACRPQSCADVKPEENVTSSGNNDQPSQIKEPLCSKFTSAFNACPKILLDEGQYDFDSNGSLINLNRNYSVKLGEYFIQFKKATICSSNETENGNSTGTELPGWCTPFDVPKSGYNQAGGRLYVDAFGEYVDKDYFVIGQDATAHVCPKMNPEFYEGCLKSLGKLDGDEVEILPNMDMKDKKNILVGAVIPRGEYMLAEDHSFVIICLQPSDSENREITLYVYGVASLISALCLLLAMLAHYFFPTLNYHAKALLCLAFTFFVMYIAMAVRNFAGNFDSAAANVIVFAVQYIFALAAFFWLSILSFDLWRVFADLKGNINPSQSASKKRQFFAKCVYAWGIPTILCIIVIAISFSPEAQHSLNLDLPLSTMNWFQDTTTVLIVFYGPIIIVLLENVIFFILTIVNIRKASSGTDILNKKVSRKLLRVYVKLFLVMGLCWFAEIISWLVEQQTGEAVWVVTDLINCLQGVFIFLIYVCKKKTWLIIRNKLGYTTSSQVTQSTSSSQLDKDRKLSDVSLHAVQIEKRRN